MAKKHEDGRGDQAVTEEAGQPASPFDGAEKALGTFAEDLGRLLGTAQAKAVTWLDQRKAITDELTRIRDAANHYLQQLTDAGASVVRAAQERRRGRPPGRAKVAAKTAPATRRKAGATKKRTLSDETKAKMRAAQQARWARKRATNSSER